MRKRADTPETRKLAIAEQSKDTNQLQIVAVPGESEESALVKARLHPVVSASSTIRQFCPEVAESGFGALSAELTKHVEDVKAGNMNRPESILLMQAQTLDAIFHAMAQRAAVNVGVHRDTAEQYLRMALKAQAQCRSTIETLAEIKSPRATQFIRQQNNANQQQVNNGVAGAGQPAHGKAPIQTNGLIEADSHEAMDARATGPASRDDSTVEAMGTVHRTQNRRRKAG